MAYTDSKGKIWPDTMEQGGVMLILDPVASLKKGRPQYRADPRQQQAYAEKYGFAEKKPEPPSPYQGLAMVGAASAAPVIAGKLGTSLGGLFGSETTGAGLSEVGKAVLGNQAGPAAGQSLSGLTGAGQAAPSVATPTGLSGQLIPAEAGMFDLSGIGSAGNVLLPAVGAYGAYDLFKSNRGANNKPMGALQGAASGAAMGSYFGPWGALAGGVIGGAYGATQHEGTKEAQSRRWGKLSPEAQMLKQASHPEGDDGIWDTGKYAGQKWSFDKALDLARENPDEFRGVYGNLAALGDGGNKYLAMSADEQREFVRRNIEAGNYASKKGDIIIKDKDMANQFYNQIKQPNMANSAQQAQQALAVEGLPAGVEKQAFMR